MYELIKINDNDYYIDCPAKIGIVKVGGNDVVLIDSGNDKDAGKKILKILDSNGWPGSCFDIICGIYSCADSCCYWRIGY